MSIYQLFNQYYYNAPLRQRYWFRILYHTAFWGVFFFYISSFYFTGIFSSVPLRVMLALYSYSVLYTASLYYSGISLLNLKDRYNLGYFWWLVCFLIVFWLGHTLNYLAYYYFFPVLFGYNQLPAFYKFYYNLYVQNSYLGVLGNVQNIFIELKMLDYMLAPLVVKFAKSSVEKQLILKELQANKLRLELQALQNQISPHFVFNVLNMAYAHILLKDETAANFLLKFSDLLRFSLYETNKDLIPLERELFFLRQYLDLEQERNIVRLEISYQQEEEPVTGACIPPLVLLTLVENAFKHGVQATRLNAWVSLQVVFLPTHRMQFHIINSIPLTQARPKQHFGMGLENVERRLNHYYPYTHTFKVEKTPTQFSVFLEIPLKVKVTTKDSSWSKMERV